MTDDMKYPPLPAGLREELDAHDAGADLQRVWQLLATVDEHEAGVSAASSEALWQRIASETAIAAPSRGRSDSALSLVPPTETGVAQRHAVPRTRAATKSARWSSRAGLSGLAAAAALAVFAWWGTSTVSVSTSAGQTDTIVLRDGSTVVLNGASALEYPRYFRPTWLGGDGRRSVTLRGEAYFRVAKGTAPFVVHTRQADVHVLGTRFNVRSREVRDARDAKGDAQRIGVAHTDVAVEEGRVQVSARAARSTAPVVLHANEQVRVDEAPLATTDASLRVTKGDPQRDLAWTAGGFAAVDQPLYDVLLSLESQYGVELTLRDSVASATLVTLYYPERTTVDRIVNDLATARGWTTRRTSRGYELRVAR